MTKYEDLSRDELIKELEWKASFPENNPNPVIEIDLEGHIHYINPAGKQLLGEMDVVNYEHPWFAGLKSVIEVFSGGASKSIVTEVKLEEFYYQQTLYFSEPNRRIRIYGIDITEKKQTEKALISESCQTMSGILEHTNMMLVLLDPQFNFIWVNRAYAATCGYDTSFFPGKNHFDLYPNEENQKIFQQVVDTGEPFFINAKPFKFPDQPERGVTYWDWSLIPIKDNSSGLTALVFTLSDVTEKILAEETLRHSQSKMLTRTESIAHIGSWEWDVTTDNVTWSNELFRIFKMNPVEGAPPFAEQAKLYPPEDMARLKIAVEKAVNNGTPYELELQTISSDGEIRICIAYGHREFDSKGKLRLFGSLQDITERKRVEDGLRKSEERFRIIYDQSPIAIEFYDAEGILKHANTACVNLFGIKNMDLPQNFSLFNDPNLPDEHKEKIHKKETVRYECPFDFEKVKSMNLYPTSKEGIIWLDVLITPLKSPLDTVGGFLVQIQDITERKRIEEEFRSSEEKLTIIAETIEEVFWMAELNIGNMFYISPGYEKVWGRSMESLYENPQSFLDTIHPEDRERVFNNLEVQKDSQPFSHEYRIIRPDGEIRWIWDRGFPISDKMGEVTKYAGIAQDITKRKLAEGEQKKLQEQLRQSQKMEALGNLAGGIAHDFNNILGAIIGFTELSRKVVPENSLLKNNLNQILKAGKRAKELVRQILTFSRKTEQEKKPVIINYIIEDAVKLLRASLPTTIEIKYTGKDRSIILADTIQIHQIIMNLGTNALHAMREYGGILEIRLENIVIEKEEVNLYSGLQPGSFIRVTVKDTGEGISPEYMEKIFEPYFTTKEIGEGTGLGLPVVLGIVKSHGGDIKVSSEEGKGTIFEIVFPVIKSKPDFTEEDTAPLPEGKENILIVDDEEILVEIIQKMLESLGYKVTASQNSVDALDIFRKNPDNFDLVITDLTMPNMTGRKLAEELHKIKPDVPVILCTGHEDNIIKLEETGISDFIIKPVMNNILANKVRNILNKKKKK